MPTTANVMRMSCKLRVKKNKNIATNNVMMREIKKANRAGERFLLLNMQ
jgi:hypothetical protein